MESVITALTAAVTPSVMFGSLAPLVPWIAGLIPVSLGIFFLRRSVKGAGTGKLKF